MLEKIKRKIVNRVILSDGIETISAEKYFMWVSLMFICVMVHLGLSIVFGMLKLNVLCVYNVCSTILYISMLFLLLSGKVLKFPHLEMILWIEIILHVLLVVYYIGWDWGFQYILLAISIPGLNSGDDEKLSRIKNEVKFVLCMVSYVTMMVLSECNVIVPIERISTHYMAEFVKTIIIILLFVTVYYMVSSMVRQYDVSLVNHRERREKENERLIRIQGAVINSIASIIESRDGDTGEHIARTSLYVQMIIEELSKKGKYKDLFTESYIKNVCSAASLHDIGKIKTPDGILKKPARLTDEEFDVIKKHTEDGGELIRNVFSHIEDEEYIKMAYEIATCHHEKWNGKGYPEGLKREEIPLVARIVAIADVYDALTSERCYKEKYDKEKALEIIRSEKGEHFDPEIADAFLRAIEREESM